MLESRLFLVLSKIYTTLVRWSSNLQSMFLLYLRITWGAQFFLDGLGKLGQMEAVVDLFTRHGIPYASLYAPFVARTEILGGALLFLGLASRFAAFPLICIMFTALEAIQGRALSTLSFIKEPLLFAQTTPYPYLLAALVIFIFGPGRISLDAWIKRSLKNPF